MGFSIVGSQKADPAAALLTQSPPSAGGTVPTPRTPTFSLVDVDRKTGAPPAVRNIVGGAPPQDRLANIKRFFPDAQPVGDNFVFTNPETGRPTLYNPEGLDVGDVTSVTPELAEAAGGAIGGALALPPALAAAGPTGGASLLAVPAGVGLGAAGGREVENLLATNLFGRIDTRPTGERVVDAAASTLVNATGQRIGDLAGAGIALALGRIRQPGQASLAAFEVEGIRAPAGAVSGNRTVQTMEQALSNMIPSADIMQRASRETIDQLDTRVTNLAGQFGPGSTRLEAGTALQRGGQEFRTRFLANSEGLYRNLNRFIPDDVTTPLPNTMEALVGPARRFQSNEAFGQTLVDPQFLRWADLLEEGGGTLPYSELRQFRSHIGRKLSQPTIISDIPRADLENLYAGISSDLQSLAATRGGAALRAFTRANNHYRAGLTRINTISSALDRQIGPENAFRLAIEQPAKSGAAKENIATLRAYRRSVEPDRWDVVAGVTLRNLGNAKPGAQDATGEAFSVSTFLTNWNKMSPDAREVLFNGTRYADLSGSLDRVVRIAGSLKATEKMANPSGTARNLYAMMLLSGLAGGGASGIVGGDPTSGIAAGLGAVLVPRQAAKLITSPGFVRWIAQAPRVNVNNPNSVSGHITRLTAVAEAEPEIKDAIQQFLTLFGESLGAGEQTETTGVLGPQRTPLSPSLPAVPQVPQ